MDKQCIFYIDEKNDLDPRIYIFKVQNLHCPVKISHYHSLKRSWNCNHPWPNTSFSEICPPIHGFMSPMDRQRKLSKAKLSKQAVIQQIGAKYSSLEVTAQVQLQLWELWTPISSWIVWVTPGRTNQRQFLCPSLLVCIF